MNGQIMLRSPHSIGFSVLFLFSPCAPLLQRPRLSVLIPYSLIFLSLPPRSPVFLYLQSCHISFRVVGKRTGRILRTIVYGAHALSLLSKYAPVIVVFVFFVLFSILLSEQAVDRLRSLGPKNWDITIYTNILYQSAQGNFLDCSIHYPAQFRKDKPARFLFLDTTQTKKTYEEEIRWSHKKRGVQRNRTA